MSSSSISAFSHEVSTIPSSFSQNPAGGSAANIGHVSPVCAPVSYQLRESFPSWIDTQKRLNNGTARDDIRQINSVRSGGLLGGVRRINMPRNFTCFQGSADAINATIPSNLTEFLSGEQHNRIARVLCVPLDQWLAHEHYLLPNNIQQVTFHIHGQDNLGGFWEVTLNIEGGGIGQMQRVTACRIVSDGRVEVACTVRSPLKLMSIAEFNAPGPQSPTAELDQFHLPAPVESIHPVSMKYLKQSMESLLQAIVADIGGSEMPVVSHTARDEIRTAATGLLHRVQMTHADDPERLRGLRVEVVQFLEQRLLPNLRTQGNAKRFTHDGVARMGHVYFSQLFDTVTLDGARNRIYRAGHLDPPKDLIGIAIRKLSSMISVIRTITRSPGQFNEAVAMFRIGVVEQGGNRVCALSGALIATSGIFDDVQKKLRETLMGLKEGKEGKVFLREKFAQKYAEGINALKSARVVPQNFQAENNAAIPTFSLIRRASNNPETTSAVDTEYRILADILRQIEEAGLDRREIIGHVYLLSRMPVCGPCSLAIADFKRQLPRLDVIVMQESRSQAQVETPPDGIKIFQSSGSQSSGSIYYDLDKWIKSLDTGTSSNLQAAATMANDMESTDYEEPFFFQLPPQQVLQQPPPQQGGSSSHAGSNIRVDQINGRNITTIYGGGQMLFVAEDLFALLSNAQIRNRNDFVRNLLPAILADYAAHVGSPSRTVLVNHDGTTYDVTYSVQGNQIMTLTVDEYFEMDESMVDMSVYDNWGGE